MMPKAKIIKTFHANPSGTAVSRMTTRFRKREEDAAALAKFIAITLPTEILILTFALLPFNLLFSLLCVNRRFFEIAAPLVWKDIRLLSFNDVNRFWEIINSGSRRSEVYRHYVRSLEIQYWDQYNEPAINYCLERLPNLQTMDIEFPTVSLCDFAFKKPLQSLVPARGSPGLRTLRAELNEQARGPFTKSLISYVEMLEAATNPLVELTLTACALMATEYLPKLIEASPQLQILRLKTCGDEDCDWEWAHVCTDHIQELARHCSKLRDVDLSDCCCRRGGDAFLDLAKGCPQLRSIKFRLHFMADGSLTDALPWLAEFLAGTSELEEIVIVLMYMLRDTYDSWCREAKQMSGKIKIILEERASHPMY